MPTSFAGGSGADWADITHSGASSPTCTENLANNVATDFTTTLNMGSAPYSGTAANQCSPTCTGQDLNYSDVVTFAPLGTQITAGGPLLPAGTKIGGLESQTNLGVFDSSCNTFFTVDFVLYSVALPNGTVGPGGTATNIAYPRPEGDVDRFGGWQIGSPPAHDGGTSPLSGTRAAGTSIAIQGYPSYLLTLFSPGGVVGAGTVIPKAVYGGVTNVANNSIPLYFAQFDSSQAAALDALGEPTSLINAGQGNPSQSVLQDPTQTVASPSSITDFCTPLGVTTTLLGTSPTGGFTRAKNPPGPAATGYVQQYVASYRDLDQDGIENQLDTCPTVVNISGDPRNPGAGPNGNGIDAACDTSGAAGNGNVDVDGDGFQNRQDNCPLVPNPLQTESELHVQQADNGPQIDGIGNACDSGTAGGIGSGADHCTGVLHPIKQNGQCISITLSTTVSNGRYMVATDVVPKCFGGTDADGDGYCATQDTGSDAPGGSDAVLHNAWGPTSPMRSGDDSDSDSFTDAQETYMSTCIPGGLLACSSTVPGAYASPAAAARTDATKSCAQTPTANDEQPMDNWPMDFNDDQVVNLTDIFKVVPGLNAAVDGPPASGTIPTVRMDLNQDGAVTLSDIFKMVPFLNEDCADGSAVGSGSTVQPAVPAWSQQ